MSVTARFPLLIAAALLLTGVALALFVVSPNGASPTDDAEAPTSPRPAGDRGGSPARVRPQAAEKPVSPARRAADLTIPASVSRALGRNRVVVVSLYAKGAGVDGLARSEARSGAQAAGVGFVALDVLSELRTVRFARRIDVFATPAVLVLERGGKVRTKFLGFADRETVAQAAANAVP